MTDTTFVAQQTISDYQHVADTVSFKDWLGLVALFLSTLVAVLVGQYLQDRKSKKDRIYDNKYHCFATILGLRHALGWNEQFVITLNQIPIIFSDNEKILERLKTFTDRHSTVANVQDAAEILSPLLNDLVLEMAKDLGYSHVDNTMLAGYFRPDASLNRYLSSSIENQNYVDAHLKGTGNQFGKDQHDYYKKGVVAFEENTRYFQWLRNQTKPTNEQPKE